jgi:outer membrane lipoprotein-sorting protein
MNHEEKEYEQHLEELFGRIPTPPVPNADISNEIRRRVFAEFDRVASQPGADSRWSRALHTGAKLMSHPASRVVAGLAAVLFLALWLGAPRRSVAFGDLLAPLVDAKNGKFTMMLKNDLQPKPIEATGYFLTPHKFRQEMPGMVSISDFDQGLMLSLDEKNKQATLIKLKNFGDLKKKGQSGDLFGNLRAVLADYRNNHKGQIQELDAKELDGRKVFGFRLATPTITQTIWGDAKTGAIVRLEATMPGPPKSEVVFSDFTFDMPIDMALFSVDPPADYKLTSFDVDVSPATEQEFIASLAAVSDAMDGVLPGSLDAAGIGRAVAKMVNVKAGDKEPTQEAMSAAFKIGKGMNFALTLSNEADAHYAGKGIKRTDPKAPIFWYKPKDSKAYRVIFNDLSTGEAEAAPDVAGAVRIIEQLKKPKAE